MPKLRHIAVIATNDPKATAEFYKKEKFGFRADQRETGAVHESAFATGYF